MVDVTFNKVNPSDTDEYIFTDRGGNNYYLYTDSRARDVQGLNPDFWDKFYFCKKIVVDYKNDESKNKITKIVSYK